ncbi:hypothetical protein SAMN02745194_04513 [Roseomonas rosea]|uniref:Uncharacterized protein n=1 Tax=Muricoccus roseus TaxID=198092 RepID=A0A1M6QU71_9PROT|nr:hypothetical protein [Roseomonas rosea]SHK23653.1 hypothetical protein SAMN02745194_04513 [Roseomonas rosea]
MAADRMGKKVEQVASSLLATSLGLYSGQDARVGMRSGMGDAATLCDEIAEEIALGGRPSQRRAELAAVATRCADAIEAMRAQVEVPRD